MFQQLLANKHHRLWLFKIWPRGSLGLVNDKKNKPRVEHELCAAHGCTVNNCRPITVIWDVSGNRNAPDFSDLSLTIPDDQECLQFSAFISLKISGTVAKQCNP